MAKIKKNANADITCEWTLMSGNLVICHDIYCTRNHKHSHRSIIFSSGKISSVQEKGTV